MPSQPPLRLLVRAALLTGLGIAAAGCANLSTTSPESYDLSGLWQLNNALSDSPSLAGLNRKQKGGRGGAGKPQGGQSGPPPGGGRGGKGGKGGGQKPGAASGSRPQRAAGNGRVRVASLQASTVEIEQNVESMGMEFDGGNYRDVSWGKRQRGELSVESGWKEGDLIIKSTGGPMPVVERYVLSKNGERLTIYIELNGGRDDLKFRRVFEKVVAANSEESTGSALP